MDQNRNDHKPKRPQTKRPQTVAISVCGLFGLWPSRFVTFRFVAVPVSDRFGLWPFRFVAFRLMAVPVCGRSGLWPFGLWPFLGLWPFRFVAIMTIHVTYEDRLRCQPLKTSLYTRKHLEKYSEFQRTF